MDRLLRQRPPRPVARVAAWVVVGNLLVICALLAGTALSLQHSHATQQGMAQQTAENLANSLSIEVGAELRLIDNALATISARQAQARNEAQRRQILAAIVAEQRRLLGHVSALRASDADGAVSIGLDADERPISIADRAYFLEAKSSDSLVISEPLRSRVNQQWCIIVARRLSGSDGAFVGVVYAVVTAEHFSARFRELAIGASGSIALRTESLQLIARHSAFEPGSTRGYGEATVSRELRRRLAEDARQGWYVTHTALDQIERLIAYRKVPDYPLLLLTGVGTQEHLASWRRAAWQQVLLVGFTLATIAAFSLYLLWKHRQERQARNQAFRLAREQQLMLENDLVGMMRVRGQVVTWANRAACSIFGYAAGELRGARTRKLHLDGETYEHVEHVAAAALPANKRVRMQIRMCRKDGQPLWIDLSGMAVSDGESLWMAVDIDMLKQREEHAYDLALKDPLTGLPNRRLLEGRFSDMLSAARRNEVGAAICYIDLDGFKPINDAFGHAAGDALLRHVAGMLQEAVRAHDIVARLGGDEFAVVLSSISSAAEAMQVMDRCRRSLREPLMLANGAKVAVDCSIGIALSGASDQPPELMRRADEAMYEAKRAGRGRIRLWRPDPPGKTGGSQHDKLACEAV